MSQYTLGIHTGHDRGVSLIKDNILIGSLSQERLDRIKHSRSYMLPYETMDQILNYFNLEWDDISCIGFSGDAIESSNIMNFLKKDFFSKYGVKIPFFPIGHHLAHAYSTYYSSGFDTCLILVADGGGDFIGSQAESESLYLGKNGTITLLESRLQSPPIRRLLDLGNHYFPFIPEAIRKKQISIGRKYEQITYLLNFKFGEAGKTMGLASYGSSMIDFSNLQLKDLNFSLTYEDILKEIYVKEMVSSCTHSQYILEYGCDVAATVQCYTERAIISLINNLCRKYNIYNVCLAGGLFLNCLTNHKILEETSVKHLYIIPSAGDDGQSIGAAMAVNKMYFDKSVQMPSSIPYLGVDYPANMIEAVLKSKSLNYTYLTDSVLAAETARLIAEGKIIGLNRGRTEIGPRALCHRSILADATNPSMKDTLNRRVKHREEFRPFAPVVTYEDQFKIFNLKADSPYMLFAATVKEEYIDKIPSVTHIDHTARIQSVKSDEEPFIYQLLKQFEKLKGVPVVLNTSFNVAGEPIVETPESTIETFLKTDIDVLIIQNYIIYKK